ncbi:MAG: protein-export chaperone SecB [SAR92 clade bacterium]|uniref:Protein-export protein SecB n=1 Tax=SAR92 clade bacterium TaxID=2315479 RepID=A0A520LPC1_9GAMM|nr:MAG: protein-export chaperone SecB [SAR92 clade bacterium]|tara:strand:+ start:335 stop:844 length:510 start_codon:yes stop_codon:yes gene_type:complete
MAEENITTSEAATTEESGPVFAIQRIYLKDLSFETPMGPSVFQKQWQPKVNQDLNTKNTKLENDLYEVALRLTLTVTDGEDTIYILEVKQAGIFAIKGLDPKQITHVINTTCPNILFPYAREAVDSVLSKGSFPALMLPPINFDALFASALKQAEEEGKEAPDGSETTH